MLIIPAASLYPAFAEQPLLPAIAPKICSGAQLRSGEWYWRLPSSLPETSHLCEAHYAVYGVEIRETDSRIPPAGVGVAAVCCPLPAPDILIDEHIFAAEQCPEGFVATGGVPAVDDCLDCPRHMRCTRVNSRRYRLAAEHHGAYWGFGSKHWREKTRLMRADLPVAIREALGRVSRYRMLHQGCVGSPAGSLLTRKSSGRCYGYHYRELQFRGLPGDPPEGTAVPMFPRCRRISNILDPQPQCIQ